MDITLLGKKMNTFQTFLDVLSQILTLFALICAGLAFVFKEGIKAYFKKIVTDTTLEKKKQIDEDLENHKSRLVGELERLKYQIELEKQLEFRVLDARVEAYNGLISAYFDAYQELIRFNAQQHKYSEIRDQLVDKLLEHFERMNEAWKGNQLFITEEMNHNLVMVDTNLRGFYNRIVKGQQTIETKEWNALIHEFGVLKHLMNEELKQTATKTQPGGAINSEAAASTR